jgi:hypothetical protein
MELTIIQLPVEMILQAFKHLDFQTLLTTVPAVCRKWRELCANHVSTSLDMKWAATAKLGNPLTDAGLCALAARFCTVRSAELSSCTRLTNKGLRQFLRVSELIRH